MEQLAGEPPEGVSRDEFLRARNRGYQIAYRARCKARPTTMTCSCSMAVNVVLLKCLRPGRVPKLTVVIQGASFVRHVVYCLAYRWSRMMQGPI